MYDDKNIKAKVIHDSLSPSGARITSMIITYPRIIMAEVNTHRALSKNSASSRAIPIEKQIRKVEEERFYPSWLGKTQKGMQASEEIQNPEVFIEFWDRTAENCILGAKCLNAIHVHKQIANRLLEPFQYVTTLVTATEWNNFFALRAHPDAQPEFMVLAFRMLDAYLKSEPTERTIHLPFENHSEQFTEDEKIKINVARCARLSYETFDGNIDPEKDFELHDQLLKSGHMSPFEHVAYSTIDPKQSCGNFEGWIQYRKTLAGENRNTDLNEIMESKPDWVQL